MYARMNQHPQEELNGLQVRIAEITQLLSKNNKSMAGSQTQLTQMVDLLQHSFNCYDQLDFIHSTQSQENNAPFQRKKQMRQISQIMKISKYTLNNLANWLTNNSFAFKYRQKAANSLDKDLMSFRNSCKLCNRNAEEIVLKEARKEIIGPMHWRELFDQELMNESPEDETPKQASHDEEYNGSVHYLSKVIKDMEQSVENYHKIQTSVTKEHELTKDKGLQLLEEFLAKVRSKMGERCLPKMNQILQKELFRTTMGFKKSLSSSLKFKIYQQFSLSQTNTTKKKYQMNKTFPNPQDSAAMDKLIEQNKRLEIQKSAIQELYTSSNSFANNLGIVKAQKAVPLSQLGRKNNSLTTEVIRASALYDASPTPNEQNRSSLDTQKGSNSQDELILQQNIEYLESTQKGQGKKHVFSKVPSLIKNKTINNSLLKKFSGFQTSPNQFRRSKMSETNYGNDEIVQDNQSEQNQQEISEKQERQEILQSQAFNIIISSGSTGEEEDYELNAENVENIETEELRKEVGCQWDRTDFVSPGSLEAISESQAKEEESKICINTAFEASTQKGYSKKQSKKSQEKPFIAKTSIKLNKASKKSQKNIRKHNQTSVSQLDQIDQKDDCRPNNNKSRNKFENKGSRTIYNGSRQSKQIKGLAYKELTGSGPFLPRNGTTFKHLNEGLIDDEASQQHNRRSDYLSDRHDFTVLDIPDKQSKGPRQTQTKATNRKTTKESSSKHSSQLRKVNFSIDNETNHFQRHTLGHLSNPMKKENPLSKKLLQPIIQNNNSKLNSSSFLQNTKNLKSTINISLDKMNACNHLDGSPGKESLLLRNNPTSKKYKQKQEYFQNRVATQGNERQCVRKIKVVRNALFQPEHLCIFGGVSESYKYQFQPLPTSQDQLNEEEKEWLYSLTSYISSLKGFKRNMYENIVSFLKNPFLTIEKTQTEWQPFDSKYLKDIVLKLLLLHRKKCSSLQCTHLNTFTQIIGYSTILN